MADIIRLSRQLMNNPTTAKTMRTDLIHATMCILFKFHSNVSMVCLSALWC